jgi:ubiquinone/menaquinone biosynthesis C-methylase UbiE
LSDSITHIQYETNKELANLTSIPYCTFSSIPIRDTSVHRILSLASLHHLTNEERSAFYKEAKRILVPGGKLLIGDVQENTNQAAWLNIFVNKYNSYGHQGIFFSENDSKLVEMAGFHVTVEYKTYKWVFESSTQMITFCKHLFHLDLASDKDILDGLQTYLDADKNNYTFEWKLLYFICSCPK